MNRALKEKTNYSWKQACPGKNSDNYIMLRRESSEFLVLLSRVWVSLYFRSVPILICQSRKYLLSFIKSSPLSMSRPCSWSHQPLWWSRQTRLPGGCHPPQWPPGGSWNVTNVICENIVMKVTALPDNGPSSSWETSSIFSRMMEPWIFWNIFYCFEIASFSENQWLFSESQNFKET